MGGINYIYATRAAVYPGVVILLTDDGVNAITSSTGMNFVA